MGECVCVRGGESVDLSPGKGDFRCRCFGSSAAVVSHCRTRNCQSTFVRRFGKKTLKIHRSKVSVLIENRESEYRHVITSSNNKANTTFTSSARSGKA